MDFGQFIQQVIDALPSWATDILNRLGLTDLSAIQPRLSAALVQGSKTIAAQALSVGKGTANFHHQPVHHALSAVLLSARRDGAVQAHQRCDPAPRRPEARDLLQIHHRHPRHVQGHLLVAIVQGALGGFIFWVLGIHAPVLWGVVMGLFSLLPAVGAAAVWLPVAIYFLATGAIWEGVVLIAFGAFVIGLVDNLLRPFLVGKDTELPDYVGADLPRSEASPFSVSTALSSGRRSRRCSSPSGTYFLPRGSARNKTSRVLGSRPAPSLIEQDPCRVTEHDAGAPAAESSPGATPARRALGRMPGGIDPAGESGKQPQIDMAELPVGRGRRQARQRHGMSDVAAHDAPGGQMRIKSREHRYADGAGADRGQASRAVLKQRRNSTVGWVRGRFPCRRSIARAF